LSSDTLERRFLPYLEL
jgi:transposase